MMDMAENPHIFNSIDDAITELHRELDNSVFKEILKSNIVFTPIVLVIEHVIGQSMNRDDLPRELKLQ